MKIQAIKSLKRECMSHLPMNLEIETLSSLGHDSIGMKAQHLSYHSCWVVKTYWACMTFSKRDFSFCDATNAMQCYARQELNMNAIYMTRRMHCKKFKSILSSLNPRQASSWWTFLHAMSETKDLPAHAKPMFITILTRLDKPLICTYEMQLYNKVITWC